MIKEQIGSLIQKAAYGLAGIGTFLGGKDMIAPEDVAAVNNAGGSIAAAIGIILAAILVHVIGSRLKKSGGGSGGNITAFLVTTAAALSMAGSLPSCSAVGSAITGQPVTGTAVQRAGHADATPILIASGDLAQAEAEAEASGKANTPPAVHGLYDAGRAAKAIREVFTESGK